MTDYIELRYSDDDGHNFSMPRLIPLGETGEFQKPLIARRLGMTRGRQWEISYSGDRRCDLIAAAVQVDRE
jgi:hypothetical protein